MSKKLFRVFSYPKSVASDIYEALQRRAEASLRAAGEVIPKESAKPISHKKHYIFNTTESFLDFFENMKDLEVALQTLKILTFLKPKRLIYSRV
jgi:hypothetical protein